MSSAGRSRRARTGAELLDLAPPWSLQGRAEVVVELDVDLLEQVHGAGRLGLHLDAHLRRSDRIAEVVPCQLEPMRAAAIAVDRALVLEPTDQLEALFLDRRRR